ncbi:MAG TPA: glycoside hydrolase N-terminal domain-containing protein, partial [Paludibacter sp.]
MKKHILGFTLLLCLTNFCLVHAQSAFRFWYNRPAEFFEETLVLGNGKTGATVFGGATSDKIYLNDATLWTGGPVNANM